MPKYSKQERAEAIERLREWVKPGDTVHCILRRVSSSGMTRVIELLKLTDGNPRYLGRSYAIACGDVYDHRSEGVKVQGCGMDMGFQLVYNLGRVLFPEGFGVEGERKEGNKVRPESKEEAARMAVLEGVKFYGRNGDTSGWDNDGGYALRCVWL